MNSNRNIVWHNRIVKKHDFRARNGHSSMVLWLTGLPAAGKSTLAHRLEQELYRLGWNSYVLDGDNVRHGLNKDLGFTDDDRRENIRRVAEVAKLFVDAGVVVIAAFISPFRDDREWARSLFEEGEFVEVYVDCDGETCEKRDPKGLYKKARAGLLPNFTGIDSAYEPPLAPDIVVNTSRQTVDESVAELFSYVKTYFRIDDRQIVNGAGEGL